MMEASIYPSGSSPCDALWATQNVGHKSNFLGAVQLLKICHKNHKDLSSRAWKAVILVDVKSESEVACSSHRSLLVFGACGKLFYLQT